MEKSQQSPSPSFCVADFMEFQDQQSGDDELEQQLEDLLKFLGDKADLNKAGRTGLTPLHIALQQNRQECAGLLLNCGADPNVKIRDGQMLLTYLIDNFGSMGTYSPLWEFCQFYEYAKEFPDDANSLSSIYLQNNRFIRSKKLSIALKDFSAQIPHVHRVVVGATAEMLPVPVVNLIHVHSTNVSIPANT